eukprot:GILK01001633.1.p1 GENE.GILK01001633.1~~GILK01001633.1.p1  ORF type:complete len:1043 (-),score=237.41 GILK01001633.1:116-2860(-)
MALNQETPSDALFVARSMPGHSSSPCIHIERKIEDKYLGEGYNKDYTDIKNVSLLSVTPKSAHSLNDRAWRLQCYRSKGPVSKNINQHIRMYFLQEPEYPNPFVEENETRLELIACKQFMSAASDKVKEQYQRLITAVVQRPGGLGLQMEHRAGSKGSHRLVVAYRRGTTHSFFTSVMDVYHFYGLFSPRKYIEQFSNGVVVYTFFLGSADGDQTSTLTRIKNVMHDLSLKYVLPRTALSELLNQGMLSNQEISYAYAGWKFAFQFLNRVGEEYGLLAKALANDPVNQAHLFKIKSRLKRNTFTEGVVLKAIYENTPLIKVLYSEFERIHSPSAPASTEAPADILSLIAKSVDTANDQEILRAFHIFNSAILKTNFYKRDKSALSFRLNPSFLSSVDYPEPPFGMLFLVGSEFRGFHVRFSDVARGGIRVVRSPSNQAYLHNVNTIFDENYGLALTQQRKNKDIPEGGAKGTLLLSLHAQDKAEVAFKKYIDAMLDVLLPHEEVRDHYQQPEILFLGPDEGTAEYMDWAALHAKSRGAAFWKAFTTGKSQHLGGIPHDTYGMTTHGVQMYVLGIMKKLGIEESTVTKFQTGGPDGDLGSNSIKMSTDKTTAIVDGSGVLCDPIGINRQELHRLANERKMVKFFDRSLLSPNGFLVLIEDRDVTLPDGTVVANGTTFRNEFHLHPLSSADLFVPCGGRPEAVNISNVERLLDVKGKPRFKYIVEGANLFFTQEARLALEKAGVVIFKDASANKGGVTSSSLEVLAALALNDDDFSLHMQRKGTVLPEFYSKYVQEVQSRIDNNATLEFECLWNEHQRTRVPNALLTDMLSVRITKLDKQIQGSSLWADDMLKRRVLSEAIPKMLLDLLGLDAVLSNVPEAYVKAIFGSYLSSRFVYEMGLDAGDLGFFEFIRRYT